MTKPPGDEWQKAANLRTLYTYMYVHPGKKLLFMGSEFGQWREWTHLGSLDWHLLERPLHEGLRRMMEDLNHIYTSHPELYEVDFEASGFEWIDCNDHESSVISLIRRSRDRADWLVAILNWTPVVRHDYRVGVPEDGYYRELFNSDASTYGGGNVGNEGGRRTEDIAAHGHPQSLTLTLPPLGGLILKLQTEN